MAKAKTHGPSSKEGSPSAAPPAGEEATSLLFDASQASYSDDEPAHELSSLSAPSKTRTRNDTLKIETRSPSSGTPSSRTPSRVPSPVLVTTPRTPRSANRVRFDLTPSVLEPPREYRPNRDQSSFHHYDDDTPSDDDDDDDRHSNASGTSQARRPLLTDIEAPSVTLANEGAGADDVHDWAEQERRRPKSGLRSAFMNMANSIIGAGIIGQPYAMRQAGLLTGLTLLVGLTVVVDWTIRLIVLNSKLSGTGSFQSTVQHCFGKPGLVAISLAQWLFAFGGQVGFGIIIGDSMPHVFRAVWPGLEEMLVLGLLANRRIVIVVFVLGISLPLTLYRDVAKLAKASTLALISMAIIVITVVTQGLLAPAEIRGSLDSSILFINDGVFQSIGVISFAFVCHHNSILIYNSIKTPTMDRFARVTHFSTGISCVACLILALAGFLTFGDKTLGNVLNNFQPDNTMVNVARLCFGLNMLTTLPLEAFVCREVMFEYFYPGAPFNLRLHVLFSTGLVVGAMVLSLLTCDLGAVFELVGATSACALAYILPPLCYIKLTARSWRTYVAGGVVVFGVLVLVVSIVQAVLKIVRGEGGPAQCM